MKCSIKRKLQIPNFDEMSMPICLNALLLTDTYLHAFDMFNQNHNVKFIGQLMNEKTRI